MGCARFADVSLDQETTFGDIGLAGGQTLEHFHPVAVTAAKLERASLIDLAMLGEHDIKAEERLERGDFHRDRVAERAQRRGRLGHPLL